MSMEPPDKKGGLSSRFPHYTERRGGPGDRGAWRRRVPDTGAPTDMFLRFFDRTHLRIGPSRAKNREGLDFEVRFAVDPPKLPQKGEKQFLRPTNFAQKNLFWPKIDLTGIV